MLNQIYERMWFHKSRKIIDRIDQYRFKDLSDEKLREKYQRAKKEKKDKALLIALIGEAVCRTLHIRPYPEQFLCALALSDGIIAEMGTGEGKTLACAIAAAMADKKVHIVTVNDYLAKRDAEKMRPFYVLLGIRVEANWREHPDKENVFEADVLYSSSSELIFDYLRWSLMKKKFPFEMAIIDEIDFVLIDNAKTEFNISTGESFLPSQEPYQIAREVVRILQGLKVEKPLFSEKIEGEEDVHYVYFPFNRTVYLTEKGHSLIDNLFGEENHLLHNIRFYKILISSLEAELFYQPGRDYFVHQNKVVLVQRESGRLMPNSQLDIDLHSAIEIKENVMMTPKPLGNLSSSYQLFFSKYGKMTGLSGTVFEVKDELKMLFGRDMVRIPSHFKSQRVVRPDMFFETKEQKYKAALCLLKDSQRKSNRPVLVICESDAEAEMLYERFVAQGGRANLLVSLSEEEESRLIEQAGQQRSVTISTNMAGRGTDILLDEDAKRAGGLFVIVLSHFESKRIDRQAIGRAARQGEPGECLFLVSFEDELFDQMDEEELRIFNKYKAGRFKKRKEKLMGLVERLQRKQQVLFESERVRDFALDLQIELAHQRMMEWAEGVAKGSSASHALSTFVKGELFDVKEFNAVMKGQLSKDKDQLLASIKAKEREIGKDLSSSLFAELVQQIANREWIVLKNDLRHVKMNIRLHQHRPEEEPREFLRICMEQLDKAKGEILLQALAYFITATPNKAS